VLAIVLGAVAGALASSSPAAREPALSWGDQGDGTFRNPVLYADYSDPDVIRVGDDFYLIASDFHFVGMQVLHSRDLVNWRIVGQVFPRLTMSPKYDAMQGYAQGTWAPSLRYHDGTFSIYVCTPYDGLFLWKAKRPEGPWSETITVKAVEGWEDPAPFWDDDGSAYLVHSRKGAGPLVLHKLSADGTQLLDEGVEIYRGPVAEGPKLFKRHGWYYVSLPEGGVEKGGQTVLRSRALYGPYERRQVLPDGSPHQGGIVDLAGGESWFIGFKSTGAMGRVCHLLPVRWGEDDWPVFGDEGRPVEQWKKPAVAPGGPILHPQTSDDFSSSALGPQWQWNHNPVAGAWSLAERRGWLRLRPQPASELTLARDTLTQKLWGPGGAVEVTLDSRGLARGQRAGLAFMSGKVFNAIGVVSDERGRRLHWDGGEGPALRKPVVRLRGTYEGDSARLFYSVDGGVTWVDTGAAITLKFGQWKGARVALFAYGEGRGEADFDDFVYGQGASRSKP
jgi:beta-xylosidase